MKTILTLMAITLASCSGVREKTWPVEMAVFGKVAPWESGDAKLRKVYNDAWLEGYIRGFEEGEDSKP